LSSAAGGGSARKGSGPRQGADRRLLLERVRARRVIPFVGAGLSADQLPSWEELIRKLWEEQARLSHEELQPVLDKHALTVVAEFIRAALRGSLVEHVQRAMGESLGGEPGPQHRLIAGGPWPAIMTTNWDSFLERAWEELARHDERFGRQGDRLPVRHRKDARRMYAELKAGLRPPPLLKLHGDFERGEEFVLGHSDYRRLMARDVDARALVRYLSSEYSWLFYGTSLTDPDVLGTLDEVHETLGHGQGPHFWLTVDREATDEFVEFLRRHYGIRTLAYPDWDAALGDLGQLVKDGWQPACSLDDLALRLHRSTVRIISTPLTAPGDGRVRAGLALAATVACDGDYTVHPRGKMLASLVGDPKRVAGTPIRPGEATRWEEDGLEIWLVCGQSPKGYGRTGLVHRAVNAFLTQAFDRGRRQFAMPVISHGGGRLPAHEALSAQLHAVGAFIQRHQDEVMEVVIHLPGEQGPGNPLTDIADGRLAAGGILARGMAGVVSCTVIHPAPESHDETMPSQLALPADGTVADLARALGLQVDRLGRLRRPGGDGRKWPVDEGAALLLDVDVTDGALVILERRPER
jgi:hypothetical protein